MRTVDETARVEALLRYSNQLAVMLLAREMYARTDRIEEAIACDRAASILRDAYVNERDSPPTIEATQDER